MPIQKSEIWNSVAMNLLPCVYVGLLENRSHVCGDIVYFCNLFNNIYDLEYSQLLPWPIQSILEVTHTYPLNCNYYMM